MTQLNIAVFLDYLTEIAGDLNWSAEKTPDRCIHLCRRGSDMIFSPLTAVYFNLTGKEIHRGSFFIEELTKEFGFPWYEILEVSYAYLALDSWGKCYNRYLRKDMLEILRLPVERISDQWLVGVSL